MDCGGSLSQHVPAKSFRVTSEYGIQARHLNSREHPLRCCSRAHHSTPYSKFAKRRPLQNQQTLHQPQYVATYFSTCILRFLTQEAQRDYHQHYPNQAGDVAHDPLSMVTGSDDYRTSGGERNRKRRTPCPHECERRNARRCPPVSAGSKCRRPQPGLRNGVSAVAREAVIHNAGWPVERHKRNHLQVRGIT